MKKLFFTLALCLSLSMALSSCVFFDSVIGGNDPSAYENTPELTTEYVYELARDAGYTGTIKEFIEEFKGAAGSDGKDGVGIAGAAFDENSHLILTLTNGSVIDCGAITVNVEGSSSITIGSNGNWYIDGVDTGKKAEATDGTKWHTGSGAPISSLGAEGDLYLDTVSCSVYKKTSGRWSVIATLEGEGSIINEGDEYNYDVTINAEGSGGRYAAAKALMSAVRVVATYSNSWSSNGSGVIYRLDKSTGDAYIITNYHVVYDSDARTANKIADKISVFLYGLEYTDYEISATYVGGSMNYDIAVLKVTASEVMKNNAALAVEIADSSEVRVLDTAIAIGNPASSGISATLGSISVESEFIEMLAPDNRTMVEYRVMRIDTPVNSGNSGGGLFDSEGRLIGIVNAKENDTSIENMGYAIPSNLAVNVANNIIRNCDGKANEQVIRCKIGMGITASDLRTEYDSENGVVRVVESCVISEFETGSIAEVVLMVGDVIKSFEIDGVTYELKHNYDGSEILLNADRSSEIYINVERSGEALRYRLYTTADNFISIP